MIYDFMGLSLILGIFYPYALDHNINLTLKIEFVTMDVSGNRRLV